MSDAFWAAREGDALLHTSMLADIVGGVLEVAATVAIGALATAAVAAAFGITVATGGLGCFVLGAAVGLVVGVAMAKTGADTGLSRLCEGIGNALSPPTVQATIASGSSDTHINGKPAARAAGIVLAPLTPLEAEQAAADAQAEEQTFLDMAKGFFSQMWRPTVASPAPNTQEANDDKVLCSKHPAMPPQYLAEGSSKVMINGHPAVRSGDRSTCEAVVVDGGEVSSDVRIGGEPIVVREIRSGKTPGIGLAISALMLLRGRGGKFYSKLGCMLLGGATSYATSAVTGALVRATSASPNPVHAATGAKVLCGEDDLDFSVQAMLAIDWQRFYSSRDERRHTLFGPGWSTAFEVSVSLVADADGSERLWLYDEQARAVDMGNIAPGEAVFSVGEGLSIRRAANGELLSESREGQYRLFQPTPGRPEHLRLSQLGDRNDNRIYLDYDAQGRLSQLRDTFDSVCLHLHYNEHWPQRVSHIEQRDAEGHNAVRAHYHYDARGLLVEVRDGQQRLLRSFAYDAAERLCQHQTRSGLRCFYEWAEIGDAARVIRHWTDAGDSYQFDYDLEAGITRVTDSLQRVNLHAWNAQLQITRHSNPLGQTWQFEWDDERQLLGATDPAGGQWRFLYDASGNLVETLDPLGRRESTTWLEHWSLPTVQTDAAGQRWQYRYDPRGNCISETDPLGGITRYRYDAHGCPCEIIDAAGTRRTLHWSLRGVLLRQTDCTDAVTRLSYDAHGHLRSLSNALGEVTDYQHDVDGRLLQVTQPDGRIEQYRYDERGLLVGYLDPAGHVTELGYNSRGQLTTRRDAFGRSVNYLHDRYGRLTGMRNANGELHSFTWDAADRLVAECNLDGSTRHYRYDAGDHLCEVQFVPTAGSDEAPIVHRMQHDAVGRLLTRTTRDGCTRYRYDAVDQLLDMTFEGVDGSSQSLGFAYDALGQLLEERSASGSLRHEYDPLGNLTRTRVADGRWINRLYYGSGHLHQVNVDGRLVSDFERDRLHREVQRSQGQLLTRSEYDRAGHLRARLRRPASQAQHVPASDQLRFAYDLLDHLASRYVQRPDLQGWQSFNHDASGRIAAVDAPSQGLHEQFHYDPAGNLLDPHPPGAGPVKHDRLLTFEDKRYAYDGFGRLKEKRSRRHGTQRFVYDAEHRLIEVHTLQPGRERVLHMHYDPMGRRIGKRETTLGGVPLGQTEFTWDGLRLSGERRDGRQTLYLYLDDGHEPLARIDGEGDYQHLRHYHNDLNGLPEQLSDDNGELCWSARYSTWGQTRQEYASSDFAEQQNLRFQGQYLDRESGLHYNLFRFYDPDIGRFTQPDPIGISGGLNHYAYAPNPFTWIDPWGLLNEGEVAGYGAEVHKNDGREAHEVVRNKFLQDKGIASNGQRLRGNPSIALSPTNHRAVHREERRLRKQLGLKGNQMLRSGRLEIKLMSKAIYNSMVVKGEMTIQQLRTARRYAKSFAKSKGCY
ncbi:RHS repeat-associated core domain-containing protein [Pseudomonas cremoricolorata]|uniref:RHS repeat-associated core domain-containing protein n=1 Tax=Pseudomonas cremoricolorata TaxID=157783 RepID=UPI00067681C3|nr:RHS repeat-associated core domain-containing protein [Pseudomonas cremoricolorata]